MHTKENKAEHEEGGSGVHDNKADPVVQCNPLRTWVVFLRAEQE